MISLRSRKSSPTTRPLSNRAIALGAVVVLGIGATAWIVLLWRYGGAAPGVELDAIRTASVITVAAGGAATLLLAARRQAHTERDSSEQRITELYTHAVDQLGAEKAPVRLGGLHALERLAQNTPTQRQTIIDVICAYLRIPYTPPDDHPPGEDAPEDAHTRYEQRRQELQVRLTAQRILTTHLKPTAEAVFWANIDLNLTEAHLHQLDLSACHVRRAQFNRATFTGYTEFRGATFAGYAGFNRATFVGDAGFDWVTFAGYALFDGAMFGWTAGFIGVTFAGPAWFGRATFTGDVRFDGATFAGKTAFDQARVVPSGRVVLPMGWTTRAAQPAEEEEEEGWLYVVRSEDSSEQPPSVG